MKIWDKYHFRSVASFKIIEQLFMKKNKIMGINEWCDCISATSESSPFWKLQSIVNIALIAPKLCRVAVMSLYYILNFVSWKFVVLSEILRTLPCPTYSRWTPPESRWFSRVHLESRFFGWEHSQIGMHNPPGFHQDSRWTPDEPHGVSGVHLPDSSVASTWIHPRVNPPGVQEESI